MFLLPFPNTFHFLSYPRDGWGLWEVVAWDCAKWTMSNTKRLTPYPENCRDQYKI